MKTPEEIKDIEKAHEEALKLNVESGGVEPREKLSHDQILKNLEKMIDGLPDDQIVVHEFYVMNAGERKEELTVSQIRQNIAEWKETGETMRFLGDHEVWDNRFIIVTPEYREEERKTAERFKDMEELEKAGVDLDILYGIATYYKHSEPKYSSEFVNEAEHASNPPQLYLKFKPEQILKFAKIIEEYYKNKK